MEVQSIKQRFGIIGNAALLNRAIDVAVQVAPTDLTVLITGESGTGKEVFPKIIHQSGNKKHGHYIAVNCGAIPEGTIDSELFGHEKGSFTGAHEARKGYFEAADGGTIFLDEVAELPLSTQVRLLRVLETGEFFKVGSSKVIKTEVRVVAASNVNIPQAIEKGKFRQDLFYRLNTVPIYVPPLRERKDDIHLLFRKFAADFAEKYRMPPLRLTDDAVRHLREYYWPGNIRQLKNVTEQISIIERDKDIDGETLKRYLPGTTTDLPVLYSKKEDQHFSERELLYKVLFDMKKDMTELKKIVADMLENSGDEAALEQTRALILKKSSPDIAYNDPGHLAKVHNVQLSQPDDEDYDSFHQHSEVIEESLSLQDKEREMVKKALERHKGKRKDAAIELGISERTLYRKIKEYNIK